MKALKVYDIYAHETVAIDPREIYDITTEVGQVNLWMKDGGKYRATHPRSDCVCISKPAWKKLMLGALNKVAK